MRDRWEPMDYWMQGYYKGLTLTYTVSIMSIGTGAIGLWTGLVPRDQTLLLLGLGVLGLLMTVLYTPRLKARYQRRASRLRRVFPVPLEKARRALEAAGELSPERVDPVGGTVEDLQGEYKVRLWLTGTTVHLETVRVGTTAVEVEPAEEGRDLSDVLEALDRAMDG